MSLTLFDAEITIKKLDLLEMKWINRSKLLRLKNRLFLRPVLLSISGLLISIILFAAVIFLSDLPVKTGVNSYDLGLVSFDFNSPNKAMTTGVSAQSFYLNRDARNIYKCDLLIGSITSMDLKAGVFDASGRLRISGPSNRNNLQEIQSFHIRNAVNEKELISSESFFEGSDKKLVRIVDFSGTLRFFPNLHYFPFDHQIIEIAVESSLGDADTIRLIPESIGFSEEHGVKGVQGYRIDQSDNTEKVIIYGSDFARTNLSKNTQKSYVDRAIFRFNLNSSLFSSLSVYVIPLAIVVFLAIASVVIPNVFWEVKLVIPPTALLTLVFMQSSYQDKIAQMHYPVILDILYLSGYMLCLVSFAGSIISTRDVAYSSTPPSKVRDTKKILVGLAFTAKYSAIATSAVLFIGAIQIFSSRGIPHASLRTSTSTIYLYSNLFNLKTNKLPNISASHSAYQASSNDQKKAFVLIDTFYQLASNGDFSKSSEYCEQSMPECGQLSLFSRVRNAGVFKILSIAPFKDDDILIRANILFQMADGSDSLEEKNFIVNNQFTKILSSTFVKSLDPLSYASRYKTAFVPNPISYIRKTPNGEILCSIKDRGVFIKVESRRSRSEWMATSYCGSMGYIHSSQIF